MGDAVNSPYLENGKRLQDCTEGLTQGKIYNHTNTFCSFYGIFRINIY